MGNYMDSFVVRRLSTCGLVLLTLVLSDVCQAADAIPTSLRASVEKAVQTVRPALVRIHVVETYYSEGRELKYEASGSGVVITAEGHVITNSHVAGHAKQIKCTFADKEEMEAELVGFDPLTDIAIIKLKPKKSRTFPVVRFGDSDEVLVGDQILAMGSPLALAQSVTLGIVSITEMILPEGLRRRGGLQQDGENVGALVRWIGHDAAIYPGNSGGPLVNMDGDIIGINEIGMGLSGAIPGNLAETVAKLLIAEGKVRRAWLGLEVQPRLKYDGRDRGVLVSGVIDGSPTAVAGVESGDLLLELAGQTLDIRFPVQLPDFNRMAAELPIGAEIALLVERDGEKKLLTVIPRERELREPQQTELNQWGVTARDLSFMLAKELKRDTVEGVIITSVRPGGPAGAAKPVVRRNDVLVEVNGERISNLEELRSVTKSITAEATEPTAVLAAFERKAVRFFAVVKVGIKELQDPGLEVRKAWLSMETQVLTRDMAELLGDKELSGFRITRVFSDGEVEKAGLRAGDLILAVDDEKMTANSPEHAEELPALIRQYRIGTQVNLSIRRGEEDLVIPVMLVPSPKSVAEMKKYQDENFEFTVRDITFIDKETEQWDEITQGVLVQQVKSGGLAALSRLQSGDLILEVDGKTLAGVDGFRTTLREIAKNRGEVIVFKVLRGIHTLFIELEPNWKPS